MFKWVSVEPEDVNTINMFQSHRSKWLAVLETRPKNKTQFIHTHIVYIVNVYSLQTAQLL